MSSGAPLTILFNFKTKPVIDSLPLPLSLVRADAGDDDSELLGLVAAMMVNRGSLKKVCPSSLRSTAPTRGGSMDRRRRRFSDDFTLPVW